MIVDGKVIAAEILARAKARAEKLPHPPKVVALVGEETALNASLHDASGEPPKAVLSATKSYLKIKERAAGLAGCTFETRPLGADVSDADAIIVQLPLPEGANRDEILDAIPLEKDADVLSHAARAQFENLGMLNIPKLGFESMDDLRSRPLVPPVAGAMEEVLKNHRINHRTNAVILGNGFLVGAPCATLLRQQGVHVQVIDIDTPKEEIAAALRAADLIVSGMGAPHFITPNLIKEAKPAEGGSPDDSQGESFRGVILIDAGTSELGGKLAGDADPACAGKCVLFTPVPGGIGPIAVAKLFENAVLLAERKMAG